MLYSVIIVDDERFVRKGLRELLDWEGNGFQVVDEADNGEDALALIHKRKPDLVITDIRMPVLDGLALIGAVGGDHGLATDFIIISGYNDFRYAQQAVRYGVFDYVLKPIDEEDMLKTLAKLRRKLDEKGRVHRDRLAVNHRKLIEGLLSGECGHEEAGSWLRLHPGYEGCSFRYALIEVNNDSPGTVLKERFRQALRETVQTAACTEDEPLLYEHRRTWGLVVPDLYLPDGSGESRTFLNGLQAELTRRFPDAAVRIYVGMIVGSLDQIRQSYLGAKKALQYKFLLHDERVVRYVDTEQTRLDYTHLSDETRRDLTEAVEENDPGKQKRSLELAFGEFHSRSFSMEAVKSAVDQFVLGIVEAIRSVDGNEQELHALEPIVGWFGENITLDELKRRLTAFAAEAGELLSGQYRLYGKGGIHKIKEYADRYFRRKDMSLKHIAGQFYMNSAYLGQLFKKSYGVYFNDHILELRIAEAKRLLRQNDKRIYEIAEEVGFSNAEYFATQFEKLEDTTPTEYRNRFK